jgi:hypothetical protein
VTARGRAILKDLGETNLGCYICLLPLWNKKVEKNKKQRKTKKKNKNK